MFSEPGNWSLECPKFQGTMLFRHFLLKQSHRAKTGDFRESDKPITNPNYLFKTTLFQPGSRPETPDWTWFWHCTVKLWFSQLKKRSSNEHRRWGITGRNKLSDEKYATFHLTKPRDRTSGVYVGASYSSAVRRCLSSTARSRKYAVTVGRAVPSTHGDYVMRF